ncbi:hypothetical protein SO802_008428 [Lithocarpus litseifolius]|uniref:Disease resistance N-terminal domain-containing protein n=1 Tax=Lithocarpus litseifolius TaxID=425828 RepID=A0AAW2D995_9ROSI
MSIVGEAVAGAALSSFFKVLFEKLSSPVLLKIFRRENVDADLKMWKTILLEISEVLNDAEEKQITKESVKTWMAELEDLTYDTDNILDLFYLQEALKKSERLLGEEHIQTAVRYHALAIAFNCMGAFKLSHQHEKKTSDILVKQLGEEDSRMRDSQNWMKTFKMRELQMNTQKQKGQALNAASAQKAIDSLKAHPDLIQAFQAAATAGGSGSSGTFVHKSLNAAIIGDNPPEGGELMKELPKVGETDGVKKEANGHPSNGPVDSKNDELTSGQEDQAPVGLGTGLASLDAMKQKAKANAAA